MGSLSDQEKWERLNRLTECAMQHGPEAETLRQTLKKGVPSQIVVALTAFDIRIEDAGEYLEALEGLPYRSPDAYWVPMEPTTDIGPPPGPHGPGPIGGDPPI